MKLTLIETINKSPYDLNNKGVNDRFANFILQNNLTYEKIKCLCNSENYILISEKDEYGLPQKNVICKSCGLIYANPRLSAKSYQKFYESNFYREIYDNNRSIIDNTINKRYEKNVGTHIFKKINNVYKITSEIRVLDFGCGGGWNLRPFKQAGAICNGIDYSYDLVEFGIKKGYTCKKGGISEIEGKYDVIILSHVYEHFLNPIDDLKKISNHLNDNGIIYIEVPNIYNFSAGQMHIPHTYCFSPDTFQYYVGFSNLKMIEFGSTSNGYHMYGLFNKSYEKVSLPKPQFETALKKYKIFVLKEKIKLFLKRIRVFSVVKKFFINLKKNK